MSKARLCAAVMAALVVWALSATAASAQAPPTIHAVDTGGPHWEPNAVTVPTGTTVTWEFDQAGATHSLTSSSSNWSIDETRNVGGDAIPYTFNAPGTYTFLCKFHGGMTGTVTVTAEPRFDVLVFSRTVPANSPHEDSIAAGAAAIQQMGTAGNYNVVHSEDATLFTDAGLRPYEVIVLLNTDGEGVLSPVQRNAFERWFQRGNGLVGIHSQTNADRDWQWMTDMNGGAQFLNHPAGANQFQNATVQIEDPNHPSTQGLPTAWVRSDEWYNFTAEPRGKVHVLATLDESTYIEEDGSDGVNDDHPIAWCSNYDRGRHFYTALGHTGSSWQEPNYQTHIRGAIEWAAGKASGDCGPQREGYPTDASFDKVTLDDNTENPMEIAIGPDRSVYYVELAGRVKMYNPANGSVRAIGTIPVHRGNENGLLGIALDPDFANNRHLYLFYSAPTPEEQHISRFTLDATTGNIDMASERVLLAFPHQRIICCHSSGSLAFGPTGDLFISTGDDTEHAASNGFAPLDDRLHDEVDSPNVDAKHAFDSRRSSGNTNDLRGKILRIRPLANPGTTPGVNSTYTVPPGNLFDEAVDIANLTRPEIYTMGHRNPFRITVDQETGYVYNGEVGPDANNDNPARGPRGYDEINQIRSAGNMGWPFCIANNKPYVDFTFPSGPSGAAFDCANGPTNDSAWNTGLSQVPPARSALLYWPYGASPDFPDIPTGNGRTAIAGPVYHYNAANPRETKLPTWYDDKLFFADWSRDWIATLAFNPDGSAGKIERFMPLGDFRHPHDIEMGPDGSLYVLEWGRDFNYAGAGINPDSGLYRIDFVKGARSPVARATSDKDSGPAPLTVNFSSEGTEDPDGDALTYSWDFGDGTPNSTEANPSHVYTQPGVYTARLTVTDATNKTGTSSVVITAGNTRPVVDLEIPGQGGIYDWGDRIGFKVNVTDPEDTTIDCGRLVVFPGILHDEGGNAHVHPGLSKTGCEGFFDAPAESGHAKSALIALVLTATYTDGGGTGTAPALEGADTARLNPKQVQAEHYNAHQGLTITDRPGAEGNRRVTSVNNNDWLYFEPVSLQNITGLTLRYTAGGAGGLVDVRLDAVDGPVVGTIDLPTSGNTNVANQLTGTITPPDNAAHRVYLVFRQRTGGPANNMFELDELTWVGKGVATDAAPSAAIAADVIDGPTPLTVNFTGSGVDPEGTALTYEWDFTTDGTVDATGATVSHTYTTAAIHRVTLTVKDATGRSRTATTTIDAYEPIGNCAGDDEFSGDTLNRNLWSVIRETPADLTVSGGRLNLTTRTPDIFGAGTGMQNIVQQTMPPAGMPWTATTRLTFNPTTNFQNAGLLVYDSDERWIKFGHVWNAGRKFEIYKELANSPQNLNTTGTVAADFPTTFQMQLRSDGTNITAYYSPNGTDWTQMGTAVTNLNGFQAPTIGVYGTSGGNTSTQVRFDWFKLDYPADPTDQFNGTALDRCRWTEIIRHDPTEYSVENGNLVLTAAHGDFFAAGANNNPNILLQSLPSGPWTAETRMRFLPNENYEQAGIVVYGNDANYVKADMVWANGRGMEFLREANDVAAGFGGFVGLGATTPEWVQLRVWSDGTTLRAAYKPDGAASWIPYGEPAQLATVPNARIGLYANDSNNNNILSRDDAQFDYFRLTAGLPDDTAPTTTSTLNPATPDGQNGWYRQNVVLTLSSEPGAATQYKIGDGAFQDYSTPVTLDQEGTTTVTYRSRDTAGNLEADKTVTVKIDKTNPTSTATLNPASPGNGGTYSGPVQVSLAGADAAGGSGLDKLEYRVDNGQWTTYANPVTVSSAGAHTVDHRATDAAGNVGAIGTVTFTIEAASGAPVIEAFADPSTGAAPLDVHFTVDGFDPDGGPLRYRWTVGGGEVLGSSFDWRFTTPGVHTVTVTATDDENSTTTDTVQVTVTEAGGAAPTVDATADKTSGPAPLTVAFSAAGSDDGPAGDLQYHWDFGDGNGTSLDQNPTHRYMTKGTYTATVTVRDGGGKTGTDTVVINVTDPPGNVGPTVEIQAAPKSGNAPLEVLFSSYATDPDGDELTYLWEFGDGDTSSQEESVRHVYRQGGSFTAKLTVSDGEASASSTVAVTVGNPPANQAPTVQIAADPVSGNAPLDVRFTASGRDPEGGPLLYTWDYGDGAQGAGRSVTHRYLTAGTYTATVTVRDAGGLTGSATVQVTVGQAPQGGVRGASAEFVVPSSVRAFRARGLRVTLSCESSGSGRASLKVTAKAAKRLKLRSRTVAARRLSCTAGRELSLRLKPTRATARRLARAKARTLRLTLSVSVKGAGALQRKVTIR